MSSPATLTVDHIRALVATLYPDDLTPSGRRVLLLACEHVEWEHALRQRPSFMQRLGVTADELDEDTETLSSVRAGWTRCVAFDGEERCGLTAFTGRDICPVHAEDRAPTRRMPDAVGLLGPLT